MAQRQRQPVLFCQVVCKTVRFRGSLNESCLLRVPPNLAYFSELLCRINGFVHLLNRTSEKQAVAQRGPSRCEIAS
jgi:hypothetical protein